MRPYSMDFRQKIIDVRQREGLSIRKLAERFQVAKSFVQKLVKQHQETGDIKPRRPGGSPPRKLNNEQVMMLMEKIEEQNDATLKELREWVDEKMGVKVSQSTLARIIKSLKYTLKKKTMYAPEKKSERVQNRRVEFWQEIREVEAKNLIFIDESGVNLALVPLYGRALKGERARGEKPQKRGRNISLIAAMSLKEVVASTNIYGAVDGITFEAFILKELVPKLWKGAVVVLDNARIHSGEMVREFIEGAGAKLIYLPPYSPEFSPIENFWSKVKAILRKLKARNYGDLIDAITNAMLQVTQEDIRNWFTHCCYCTL